MDSGACLCARRVAIPPSTVDCLTLTRFVESEVDLDEELKKLHVLATAPELYPELVKHDSVVSLLHLLGHENSDISISTISLLYELTETDTISETEGALALVDALVWARTLGYRAFGEDRTVVTHVVGYGLTGAAQRL